MRPAQRLTVSDTPTVMALGAVLYLDEGLATAGLLAARVRTDVQNVLVDLQLMALKLL